MRNTDDTIAWLKGQHDSGSVAWRALCLKLTRSARGIPAVYPSALSAMVATPREYRVTKVDDIRRGMIAYFDDPNDSNPYGHIVTCAGRAKDGEPLYWSNDIRRSGGVDKVRHSIFAEAWGDSFQFAATWLNGQELIDINVPKGPAIKTPPKKILDSLKDLSLAIEDLRDARDHHQEQGNTRLAKALTRDIGKLREARKQIKATIDKFDG